MAKGPFVEILSRGQERGVMSLSPAPTFLSHMPGHPLSPEHLSGVSLPHISLAGEHVLVELWVY